MNGLKHYFIVSLCKNGLLGGGIAANTDAITYHTGKVTVSPKYRNLEMRYEDMLSVSLGRFLLFPTVAFDMKNGETHKFMVFARKRFLKLLKQNGVGV